MFARYRFSAFFLWIPWMEQMFTWREGVILRLLDYATRNREGIMDDLWELLLLCAIGAVATVTMSVILSEWSRARQHRENLKANGRRR
jgi:hypothetical protein